MIGSDRAASFGLPALALVACTVAACEVTLPPGVAGIYTSPESATVYYTAGGDPFDVLSRPGFAAEEFWCAAGQYARFAGAAHNIAISMIPPGPETPNHARRFTFGDLGASALPSGLNTIGVPDERAISASKARSLCTVVRARAPNPFGFL